MIGDSLLHYQVTAKLGQGGMGEVYRATDTKLDREVAIKVLPGAVAQDAERLARFEREAKVLAQLSHANIATVHGFDQHEGMSFLVMEHVAGEDLSERLQRGALSVEEAIEMGKQIAEALEAAHGKGIIHRDLKPANIKVTAEGEVKVLDFGLAKALSGDSEEMGRASSRAGAAEGDGLRGRSPHRGEVADESPTITDAFTKPGTVLGTAAYMSPEQAKGQALDQRTDIWAFGCVLFECLAGKRAFQGSDSTETLAEILRGKPDWSLLPEGIPRLLLVLLRQCLVKDRRRRFHAIADARLLLEGVADDSMVSVRDSASSVPPLTRRAARVLWPALAAVFLIGWIVTAFMRPEPASNPGLASDEFPRVGRRLLMTLGSTSDLRLRGSMALSPDGSKLAFGGVKGEASSQQLFVRELSQLEATAVPLGEQFSKLCFSPDGQEMVFVVRQERAIKKVAVKGGEVFTLCRTKEVADYGLDWGEDGRIVFATGAEGGILEVKASGSDGVVKEITTPDARWRYHRWPKLLPGGRGLLFSAGEDGIGRFNDAEIVVQRPAGGEIVPLGIQGHHAHYLPNGYLVFVRGRWLYGIRFDLEGLKTQGEAQPLLKGFVESWGQVALTVARNGDLVYRPQLIENKRTALEWVDQKGNRGSALPVGKYNHYEISPDGEWLIFQDESGRVQIVNLESGLPRILQGDLRGSFPIWSPSGEWIIWASKGGLLLKRPGDGREGQRLIPDDIFRLPLSWRHDGRQVIFFTPDERTNGDLRVLNLVHTPEKGWQAGNIVDFQSIVGYQDYGQFSPDGEWIAYISSEMGNGLGLFVSRLDSPAEKKTRVTTGDFFGGFPKWRGTDELLYLSREADAGATVRRVHRVRYSLVGDDIRTEPLEPWPGATTMNHFAVHPDGNRILVQKPEENPDPQKLFGNQVVLFADFAAYVKEQIGEPEP